MLEVLQIVSRLERTGGRLELDGDRIRYFIPSGNPTAQDLLAELRNRREEVAELLRCRVDLSAASQDAERRFAAPHARLFPFLGRKVRTPAGVGTLIQVFAQRCTVVLDSQASQCARFSPDEIEPVSWELP